MQFTGEIVGLVVVEEGGGLVLGRELWTGAELLGLHGTGQELPQLLGSEGWHVKEQQVASP